MALSVLPGRALAISHHLLPNLECIVRIILSSSGLHFSLRMLGSKWLCHLSRHYFPILPGSAEAIVLQFLAPCFSTIWRRMESSSSVQGPFETKVSFLSSNQRLKHCISERLFMHLETLFHLCSPNFSTKLINFAS